MMNRLPIRAHHRYDLVELQFFAQQPKGKQNSEEG